jgi:hypothetical protein
VCRVDSDVGCELRYPVWWTARMSCHPVVADQAHFANTGQPGCDRAYEHGELNLQLAP